MSPKLFTQVSDHITRGWFVVVSGQMLRLALGLVSSVLIARALGVRDFGVYGVLAAVSGITQVVLDLGLATAVVQRVGSVWEENRTVVQTDLVQQRVRVFFWLRWLIVALFVVIGWLLAPSLAQLILGAATPDNLLWMRLTVIGVMATLLSSTVVAVLRAVRRFHQINAVIVTNAALTAVWAVILAFTGQLNLSTALLILGIGTALVAAGVGYFLLPPPFDGKRPSFTTWKMESRQLLRFGRWIALSGILTVLARQLDVLMLNHWFTSATVGIYALALNLAAKFEIITHSQYTVLVPAAVALRSPGERRRFVVAGLRRNGIIVLLSLPVLWLIGPFIRLFYGVAYSTAVPLFQLLYLLVLFDFLVLPVVVLFFPLDQPRWLALADGVQLVVFGLLAVWWIPAYGPVGAIAAKGCGRVAGFLLLLLILKGSSRAFPHFQHEEAPPMDERPSP